MVEEEREGQPQGSPSTPLLSNIILHELDEELESCVNGAWSPEWFSQQGLLTVSGEQRPHWRDLEAYPEIL